MNIIGQKNVAICYSCKDRVDFSKQTLPAVLAESDKFDLYIVDGSSTDEGKNFVYDLNANSKVAGVHANVTGGADIAIVYALSFMIERGYDYCGLIENDVALEEGWFNRVMPLFREGIGSVSARCYADRVLQKSNGAALMANIGAGMVIFTRRAAETVLDYYRNGSFVEYQYWPSFYLGLECPTPHEIQDPKLAYQMTADWFFESSLMSRGLLSVACTPSIARCLDVKEQQQSEATVYEGEHPLIFNRGKALIGHYDPGLNAFVAQPHQIFTTFPDAFTGEWKLTWAKHNGPFGMRTENGEFNLDAYGSMVSIILDITDGANIEAWIDGALAGTLNKGSGYCTLQFSGFKQHQIKLKISGKPVTVMTTAFCCPQPWFKDGYGLRYSDLAKYL